MHKHKEKKEPSKSLHSSETKRSLPSQSGLFAQGGSPSSERPMSDTEMKEVSNIIQQMLTKYADHKKEFFSDRIKPFSPEITDFLKTINFYHDEFKKPMVDKENVVSRLGELSENLECVYEDVRKARPHSKLAEFLGQAIAKIDALEDKLIAEQQKSGPSLKR